MASNFRDGTACNIAGCARIKLHDRFFPRGNGLRKAFTLCPRFLESNSRMRGAAANGPKIKLLRKQLGLTQAELAERAGCDVKTVGRSEQGQTLDTYILRKLADALAAPYAEVVREPLTPETHESRHAQVVHDWRHALFAGDVPALVKPFRPDGVLRIPGEAGLPGSGLFHGRQEVAEGLAQVFALAEMHRDPRSKCVIDPKDQHVYLRGRAILERLGQSATCPLEAVLVFRFQRQRIAELSMYFDTLALYGFFGGPRQEIRTQKTSR
jgi:transcriptional regulator with XRE-family HTH domain